MKAFYRLGRVDFLNLGGSSGFMAAERYVTDHEFNAFHARVPEVIAHAMDLSRLTGHGLSALLKLRWKDIEVTGLPRDKWMIVIGRIRSERPRKMKLTMTIEDVLKACRRMKPYWPREYVLRLEDGDGISVKEFKAIWNLYMGRWAAVGMGRPAFAFRDIRMKALADHQTARSVARRRTPRSGPAA